MDNPAILLGALFALIVVVVLLRKIRALQRDLASAVKSTEDAREQLTTSAAAAKKLMAEQRERAAAASAEATRLIDEQRQLMVQEVARAEAHFQAQALQRQ